MKPRILLSLAAVVLITSACASPGTGWRENRTACTVGGALLGAAIGAVAANENHSGDENDGVVGGAIGAGAGGLLGYVLCAPPSTDLSVRATGDPMRGTAPQDVTFNGVPSSDVVEYLWDFGDGTKGSGKSPSHRFSQPGDYMATLTVRDASGRTASTKVPIHVAAPRAAAPAPAPARRIVLRGVNFEFDSAQIRPDAQVILDLAAETLSSNPGVAVGVVGHTDSRGADAYNQGLSERRARSVRDYLTRKGVSSSRMTTAGRGESQPTATNDTDAGRAENRRVELNVR